MVVHMEKKALRITEEDFNDLFLTSVDEALSALGESAKKAIYFHIEKTFKIKRQEIPNQVEQFAEALESMFGPGCKSIELMFMERLHTKVKDVCGLIKPEEFTFPKYILAVKQKILTYEGEEVSPKQSNNKQCDWENFITLLNLVADPAVVVDEKGIFLLVNSAFENYTGLKYAEVIGTPFINIQVLTTESKLMLVQNLRRRSQNLPIEPYEITFNHPKTGEVGHCEVNGKKILYDGQLADLVVFRDITQRKKNEIQLKNYARKLSQLVDKKANEIKANEARLRGIFDSSPDAIFVTDQIGTIVECNQATLSMFGFTLKSEVIGKNAFEYLGKDAQKALLRFEDIFKDGVARNIEYEFILKNGSNCIAEFSASVLKESSGENTGYIIITEDITKRKKAENTLRESEQKFRNLSEELESAQSNLLKEKDRAENYLDAADVLLLALDTEGKITLLNRKGCTVLGCTFEDAYGKNWFDTFVPIDLREERKRLQELRLKRKSYAAEYIENDVLCSNGDIRTIAWRHTILRNAEGKNIGTLSSGEDITEQKQNQKALAESEEKFRAISNSAMDAIILANEKGEIVYWNPAAETIFGFAHAEAVGQNFGELVVPNENINNHRTGFQEVFKNKGEKFEKRVERKALRKDGKQIPIELSIAIVELKNKPCLLAIIRDVSERKKMEAVLKQEREMLDTVTDNIGAGLAIIDRNYQIVWSNKFLNQMYGNSENKLCYSTYNSQKTVCPECGVKKIFEGALFDSHEFCAIDDQGKRLWIDLIVTPIKDKDGKVIAALELAVNITERKHMQEKLADYSGKLEKRVEERTLQLKQTQSKLVKSERLAAIGQLAGMVGHDLRNPLTSIKAAMYFLNVKYSSKMDTIGKDMLATIDKSIEYSNKIINDLLDFSREIKLEYSKTTPKILLTNTLSLIEIPEKIKINDLTTETPTCIIDTGKMSRVFINFIKNAFDAMPNGGTLTIISKETEKDLQIIFTDNGSGMTQETLNLLWTPLFTTKAKGMGFGLPICKRIIDAHCGKIDVISTVGKGTQFTITIPIDPNPATIDEIIGVVSPPVIETTRISTRES